VIDGASDVRQCGPGGRIAFQFEFAHHVTFGGSVLVAEAAAGQLLEELAITGVIFSCSPLVKTSFNEEGTSPVRSTASARYCSATKGTMMRLIFCAMILRRSWVLFSDPHR
jgi:hypothetical protein